MKKLFITLFLAIATIGLTACDSGHTIKGETITIKHSLGTTKVSVDIKRAVVFDLGLVDILQQLEVEVTLGLPVASLPDYLSQYKNATNVGTLKDANPEAIYEFAPDVILISARQAPNYEEFNKIAPTVYVEVNSATYLEDVEKNINLMATLFDAQDKASALLDEIRTGVEELQETSKFLDKKVLIVLVNGDTMSAYGSGSRFGIVHDLFGFKQADPNIEVATHGQSINYEYLSKTNPDIIFVVDRASVVDGEASSDVFKNDLLKNMSAYVNNDIYYMDAVAWYTVTGGITSTKTMIENLKSAVLN